MNWTDIKKEYETTATTLKTLAEKHGVKLGTLKSRKSREGWERDATSRKDATKVATPKKKDATKPIEQSGPIVESENLTDKQRLFCIYYIKSFNATMAAVKAGYSPDTAHVQGSRLLKNVKVAEEIRKLKNEMQQGVFVDAMDVLNKYIKIAFSDITDYVEFGTMEKQEYDEEGQPLLDTDGKPETRTVSFVDFKDHTLVDGTIITEIKQGREGVSVKLADKMKALDMLTKYFDLLSENDKKRLQEEKLKAETAKAKAEADKIVSEDNSKEPPTINIIDTWSNDDE